ncbi:MAG: hypothetical protein DSM106950_32120 [Stigonema ocellatum SAG 48.90 = DSM 106950]|nr:hypothetical protein [Stigonema ocellatum SAG 48.90 = DSM 106950]
MLLVSCPFAVRRPAGKIIYITNRQDAKDAKNKMDFPKEMVEENQVKMIIYNVDIEVILEWKK